MLTIQKDTPVQKHANLKTILCALASTAVIGVAAVHFITNSKEKHENRSKYLNMMNDEFSAEFHLLDYDANQYESTYHIEGVFNKWNDKHGEWSIEGKAVELDQARFRQRRFYLKDDEYFIRQNRSMDCLPDYKQIGYATLKNSIINAVDVNREQLDDNTVIRLNKYCSTDANLAVMETGDFGTIVFCAESKQSGFSAAIVSNNFEGTINSIPEKKEIIIPDNSMFDRVGITFLDGKCNTSDKFKTAFDHSKEVVLPEKFQKYQLSVEKINTFPFVDVEKENRKLWEHEKVMGKHMYNGSREGREKIQKEMYNERGPINCYFAHGAGNQRQWKRKPKATHKRHSYYKTKDGDDKFYRQRQCGDKNTGIADGPRFADMGHRGCLDRFDKIVRVPGEDYEKEMNQMLNSIYVTGTSLLHNQSATHMQVGGAIIQEYANPNHYRPWANHAFHTQWKGLIENEYNDVQFRNGAYGSFFATTQSSLFLDTDHAHSRLQGKFNLQHYGHMYNGSACLYRFHNHPKLKVPGGAFDEYRDWLEDDDHYELPKCEESFYPYMINGGLNHRKGIYAKKCLHGTFWSQNTAGYGANSSVLQEAMATYLCGTPNCEWGKESDKTASVHFGHSYGCIATYAAFDSGVVIKGPKGIIGLSQGPVRGSSAAQFSTYGCGKDFYPGHKGHNKKRFGSHGSWGIVEKGLLKLIFGLASKISREKGYCEARPWETDPDLIKHQLGKARDTWDPTMLHLEHHGRHYETTNKSGSWWSTDYNVEYKYCGTQPAGMYYDYLGNMGQDLLEVISHATDGASSHSGRNANFLAVYDFLMPMLGGEDSQNVNILEDYPGLTNLVGHKNDYVTKPGVDTPAVNVLNSMMLYALSIGPCLLFNNCQQIECKSDSTISCDFRGCKNKLNPSRGDNFGELRVKSGFFWRNLYHTLVWFDVDKKQNTKLIENIETWPIAFRFKGTPNCRHERLLDWADDQFRFRTDGMVNLNSCIGTDWGNQYTNGDVTDDAGTSFYTIQMTNHEDGTGTNGNGWAFDRKPLNWYSRVIDDAMWYGSNQVWKACNDDGGNFDPVICNQSYRRMGYAHLQDQMVSSLGNFNNPFANFFGGATNTAFNNAISGLSNIIGNNPGSNNQLMTQMLIQNENNDMLNQYTSTNFEGYVDKSLLSGEVNLEVPNSPDGDW
jgi:hypothetical protein